MIQSPAQGGGEPPPAGDGWKSFAVFAGGAERLDAALERSVGPGVTAAGDLVGADRWYFVRWVGPQGPHLRLSVRARAWSDEGLTALVERLREGLDGVSEAPVLDPVLPRPASERGGGAYVGVERDDYRFDPRPFGGDEGVEVAERLFHISSEVVLEALSHLSQGQERLAFGLALMTAVSEVALAPEQRQAFWGATARSSIGDDERGRRILERLGRYAEQLGPGLTALASSLAAQAPTAAGLERFAAACREGFSEAVRMPSGEHEDIVGHHAHLTANRLGVNPLEQALLATVLATGSGARLTVSEEPDAAEPPGTDEVLRVEQVSKHQGDDQVLDDVSFSVSEGEVFGLLGPDGAGKASLLGVAAGMRVASQGSVRLLGRDPRTRLRELAGEVGVLLPESELVEDSSVRENLELRARAVSASVDDVLETVGLRDRASVLVGDLDPGERRRLALAWALVGDPSVVFLEDPTRGLAPSERESLWKALERVNGAGTTIVLATSSLQEVRSTCHRAALVVGGALLAVEEPESLAEHHFRDRSLHFQTAEEPDLPLLQDLPEVDRLRIQQRPDHWAVEVGVLQPDELLRLLGVDPDFPRIVAVSTEDLEATFATAATEVGVDQEG